MFHFLGLKLWPAVRLALDPALTASSNCIDKDMPFAVTCANFSVVGAVDAVGDASGALADGSSFRARFLGT